jgi:hypothetical protein
VEYLQDDQHDNSDFDKCVTAGGCFLEEGIARVTDDGGLPLYRIADQALAEWVRARYTSSVTPATRFRSAFSVSSVT